MRTAAITCSVALLLGAVGCVQEQDTRSGGVCFSGKCDDTEGRGSGGSGSGGAPLDTAGPQWNADWTLLVFAANDDRSKKLVSAFDQDLAELQYGLGGSSLFRILVQRDYAKHQLDAQGQPMPTERFGFYREQRFNPQSMKVENPATGERGAVLLGETDTTDPQVLRDFLVDGIRRFPAKRYWVIITGHGDGWNGLSHDSTTGAETRMPLAGLRQALLAGASVIKNEIRTRSGLDSAQLSERIDVVQFDICRMGNVEAASALADAADYMFASQEIVPNAGHPYAALRQVAQDHTGVAPQTVLRELVTDYVRSYVEGVSTVGASYVGNTVSAVGLDLRQLSGLLQQMIKFRDAVLQERPQGFSCSEVAAIAEAAAARANLVEQPGGRSPLRDADPAEVQQAIDQQGGRASVAAKAAVDVVALFETIAGKQLLASQLSSSCFVQPDPTPEPNIALSAAVRQAAMGILDVIGRPTIATPYQRCGARLRYGDQFRQLSGFKARGDTGYQSPFVVEAHKVDGGGRRATGISVLWGDAYDLLFIEHGTTPLQTYQSLPFEQLTGWTKVFGQCIAEAQACRDWRPDSGTPNPC